MTTSRVFRLTLLGNPRLSPVDGESLPRQTTQRHRIALLALAASSGDRGMSRDKAMGYLWPERDLQHARNALNVSVYNIRKALGDSALETAGDDLRLNPTVVRVDVPELDAASEAADHEAVVSLYRGPFLDGFFLSDAAEFERWVERERKRLADSYAESLEQLAAAAAEIGDPSAAAAWWGRRAAHDPYDSRVALQLVRSLAAAGNRAGALRHARRHEQLVGEDLGLELPPGFAAEAEGLRVGLAGAAASPAVPRKRVAPRPHVAAGPAGTAASVATPPEIASRAPGGMMKAARRREIPRRTAGAAALLLLASVFFGADHGGRGRALLPAPAVRPAIAVLPVASQGLDPEEGFLADDMTDQLITRLARTGEVGVVARTSAFAFPEPRGDLREIAHTLGVSYVLEGGLQLAGTRLLVRVRLVDARDGSTLWSETYDRELQDIFAVHDEIARAVTIELGLVSAGPSSVVHRGRTQNVAAYELFLRGSDPALLRSDSGVSAALEYLGRAVALDSGYAAAHAAMARLHLRAADAMSGDVPLRDPMERAEEAAARALVLDGDLGDGHAVLGLIRFAGREYALAEMHLRRAIHLDPASARTREWLVGLYIWWGRYGEALEEAGRAVGLDPLSPSANAELAHALAANGRCDEALERLGRLSELQPPLLRAAPIRAQCYAQMRMWDQALATLREAGDRGPHRDALVGYLLARAGATREAVGIRDALVQSYERDGYGAHKVALVHAGLGDLDQAFDWLDRSVDEGSLVPSVRPFNIMAPVFHDLHQDPRFRRLRARIGLPSR